MACSAEEPEDKEQNNDNKDKSEKAKNTASVPPKVGNFALPSSQQPGPLVGFGTNIIDGGVTQFYLMASDYKTRDGYYVAVVPSVLYAFTDVFSVYFDAPIQTNNRIGCHTSCGLGDFFVQLEYAYYTAESCNSSDTATIVGNFTLPTGSARKDPWTGFGSPSFFLGGTYFHMTVDWFYFGALGAILTTFHSSDKAGDQYLYQFGFGRNIPSPCGWIFAWMIEFDGTYYSRDIEGCLATSDSGGNVVFVTPSLWISNDKLIIQLGAGGILTQNLFGRQPRYTYQAIGSLGWTF